MTSIGKSMDPSVWPLVPWAGEGVHIPGEMVLSRSEGDRIRGGVQGMNFVEYLDEEFKTIFETVVGYSSPNRYILLTKRSEVKI